MNKYGLKILNSLLDKYERSVLSKQGSNLHLQIKFNITKIFPKYNHSDYYRERVLIDEISYELQNLKLLFLEVDDDDNILEVKLNLEKKAIEQAYQLTKRIYLPDYQTKTLNYLNNLSITIDWIDKFRKQMIDRLNNYRSVNRYFNLENISELEDIFTVLLALPKQDQEISFRKFSLKVLKDSKKLETIKGKIVNIITDFYPGSFTNEDELFATFNVLKNPGFIYLSGDIVIKINDQIIDIGRLNSPFSLTTENIERLEIIRIDDQNVLTIENLTSFYDTVLSDTLIIYLGGYHNSLRRKILLKIYDFAPQLNYLHFGDIDAGGFYIYRHLKEKTQIPFKTVAMDIETLQKYQNYTKKLTQNDQKRLISLKEKLNLPVIDYMLEHNCKLEQEIVEIDNLIKKD